LAQLQTVVYLHSQILAQHSRKVWNERYAAKASCTAQCTFVGLSQAPQLACESCHLVSANIACAVLWFDLQVQSICRLVLRRSARLATSLLVAVLRLQDWMQAPRRLVVAVDGGVFLKCKNWRKYLTQYLAEAFGETHSPTRSCSYGWQKFAPV